MLGWDLGRDGAFGIPLLGRPIAEATLWKHMPNMFVYRKGGSQKRLFTVYGYVVEPGLGRCVPGVDESQPADFGSTSLLRG